MEPAITSVLFYTFSATAVVSAVFVIIRKNPVASAMNLVVTFFSISGIFVLLDSQFIAIMQVLVYAGAIMVLILFVIMLLNLRGTETGITRKMFFRALIIIIPVSLMALLLITVVSRGQVSGEAGGITSEVLSGTGSVQVIARSMFSQYLLPFELVSLLITIAVIGAVVLSRGGLFEKNTGRE